MSDFSQLVLSFLLVLGPLVMIHELGHFVFAKRAGIRVMEFGVGFPPRARRLWRGMGKFRIGSTWVHTPRNFKFPPKLEDGVAVQAHAAEVKERLMLTSIVRIEDKETATTPRKELAADGAYDLRGEISNFDPGTEYTLNWLPIGGFVRMVGEEDPSAPDSFAAAPKRWRTAVLLAGPGMNLVAAVAIFCAAFMLGQLVADRYSVVINGVAPGSPAEEAGLASGMVVLAVEGSRVNHPDDLTGYTHTHLGQVIRLTVRDTAGAAREIDVLARADPPDGQGPMGVTIGAQVESYKVVYRSFPEALAESLQAIGRAAEGLLLLPGRLLTGQIDPGEARFVGPAGIAQMTSYALEASIDQGVLFPLLNITGVISIALAVTNLLPLPALDGGRLVFVLIEAARGRRIAPEKEAIVHFAGLVFLLALAVLITIQDVSNPIPNPF